MATTKPIDKIKTVKIKIDDRMSTDASEIIARGWHVSIYRSKEPMNDFITVIKDNVRFTFKMEEAHSICVKKYIDGDLIDTKSFYDSDCGLVGAICIREFPDHTPYAFFRNRHLIDFMHEFHIKRVEFPKTADGRFEKSVFEVCQKDEPATSAFPPPFHTNGTYTIHGIVKFGDKYARRYDIANASYIYEYNTDTITIPWIYDIDVLSILLRELGESDITDDE